MKTTSIIEWRELRKQNLFKDKKMGFIPTMGNLHAGHKSLMKRSVQENDVSVLSLFVNPTQFDNPKDLTKYPRTLTDDLAMAEEVGIDFVLCPEYKELYPDDYRYQVTESQWSQQLCGKHRPGHFTGVLTVVLKLLNLVQPAFAYFGEKDFQQLQLIKEMVEAFFLDVTIVACPTVRDENNFALSSRNKRLTAEQYNQALEFPKLLNSTNTCEQIISQLTKLGFVVDYIEEHNGRRFGAVRLGEIRLIDNVMMGSSLDR